MARLVGAVCTSHVPAIGHAIARGMEREAKWEPSLPAIHERASG